MEEQIDEANLARKGMDHQYRSYASNGKDILKVILMHTPHIWCVLRMRKHILKMIGMDDQVLNLEHINDK